MSVRMMEPKCMETFVAFGGIATAFWFKRKDFLSWNELKYASRPGVRS